VVYRFHGHYISPGRYRSLQNLPSCWRYLTPHPPPPKKVPIEALPKSASLRRLEASLAETARLTAAVQKEVIEARGVRRDTMERVFMRATAKLAAAREMVERKRLEKETEKFAKAALALADRKNISFIDALEHRAEKNPALWDAIQARYDLEDIFAFTEPDIFEFEMCDLERGEGLGS